MLEHRRDHSVYRDLREYKLRRTSLMKMSGMEVGGIKEVLCKGQFHV